MLNTTHTKNPLIHLLTVSVVVLLSLLMTGCGIDVPSMTAKQAADLFAADKAIIIDVRENDEWLEQHIKGAMLIPLSQIKKHVGTLGKYKDSTIIMQCHSGKRSYHAATTLIRAGFSKVYNLEGGILAWNEQKLGTVLGVAETPY